MISESDLEFWKTELEYLKEDLGEENGFLWAQRFERLFSEIRKMRGWLKEKDELIRYCLGPTRDVKTPKLQEALAIGNEEEKSW